MRTDNFREIDYTADIEKMSDIDLRLTRNHLLTTSPLIADTNKINEKLGRINEILAPTYKMVNGKPIK